MCIQRGDHRMPYLCKSFATNEPYIQLRIWEKETSKITHSMPLHTPTNCLVYLVPMTDFLRDWDQQITSQSKIMHPMPPRAPRLPEFPYRFGPNSRSPVRVGSTDLLCEWDQQISFASGIKGSRELINRVWCHQLWFTDQQSWNSVDQLSWSLDPTRKGDLLIPLAKKIGNWDQIGLLMFSVDVDPLIPLARDQQTSSKSNIVHPSWLCHPVLHFFSPSTLPVDSASPCVTTNPRAEEAWSTGWRRPIGYLKLQVIFCRRATNWRVLLQKMSCKDKASCAFTPPCVGYDVRYCL